MAKTWNAEDTEEQNIHAFILVVTICLKGGEEPVKKGVSNSFICVGGKSLVTIMADC